MQCVYLREQPALAEQAVGWFSGKWGIPAALYLESMQECIRQRQGAPQWYVVLDGQQKIIAGAGVIDNDFHVRKDLAPNLCALYVEEPYRRCGIAKQLLDTARRDFGKFGVARLYLITEHTAFYERCGWEYLCMVRGEDGAQNRMYVAKTL